MNLTNVQPVTGLPMLSVIDRWIEHRLAEVAALRSLRRVVEKLEKGQPMDEENTPAVANGSKPYESA